jgi:methylamine dehydrogenase accessory protein MauD
MISIETFLLISHIVQWIAIILLGFLLFGTLRSLGLMRWWMEQLEATTPRRLGRDGLKVGKKAPDFSLPNIGGEQVTLSQFGGKKVLLVFTQSECSSCHDIVPELERIHRRGEHHVVVVNHGDVQSARTWMEEARMSFPVLVQEKLNVSLRYQVFATPFGFLIDEKGIIAAKGIVGHKDYLGYLLSHMSPGVSTNGDEQEHELSGGVTARQAERVEA